VEYWTNGNEEGIITTLAIWWNDSVNRTFDSSRGVKDESIGFNKETLCEMQDSEAQRRIVRDL